MSTSIKSNPPRSLSILVVEDEAVVALEIQDRLSRLGFTVVGITDSGEKAIVAAERAQPDLILMDIRLKGKMDGIEAATHIRQSWNIPVVYLTAHSDSATLQRAKETAPFGYVTKPFQEKDLLVAIEMASHRHFLEQRLKETEQTYAATLASVGDGVIATDAEGRLTYMNPVAEALTGWALADAQGLVIEQVFSLVHERSRTALENPVSQTLRDRKVVRLTEPALLVSRNHDLIPIDDSAAPITTGRGNVVGAVVAFRDIRGRRLAEDALRNAEEQLRQSHKMEAVGRLAGGVAHDFNNLLTVINGYCALLLDGGRLDETSTSEVRQIRDAGERAAKLTKQLLAFGRKQILKAEELDVNAIIFEMRNLLGRLIGEDIGLNTILNRRLWQVKADSSQIEQVIMNLAVNARDAMPEGGQLTIETSNVDLTTAAVGARPEMRAGRYVMIAVSDTGSGFDEAVKAHIFEPFFTTKEPGKGTGLGLATVYGIVKQSQGFIYPYSVPGQGTTFKIYLPAVENAANATANARSLVECKFPAHGSETILLVEDEDEVRAVSASILNGLGYTVLQATDGEEAIRVSEKFEGKIHLLVTDVVMPKVGGRQLAEQLASLRPGIRVLYVSGYTDDAVVLDGVLQGEATLLQKPFTPTTLAAKVRVALDQ